ncbi:MAG TPA: hypothetical protein VNM72_13350 [Blastocatellia bacterium]|nr:hypothetical protein [Blastocatellia bacterium]
MGLEPVRVNVERMIHIFWLAARELVEIWHKFSHRHRSATFRRLSPGATMSSASPQTCG